MQGGAEHVAQHDSVTSPPALPALQAAAGTAGEGGVAYVATAEELQAAAGVGARHIVITAHLDLSSLAAFKGVKLKRMIETRASTWSIRVRFLQHNASAPHAHEDRCMCSAGHEYILAIQSVLFACIALRSTFYNHKTFPYFLNKRKGLLSMPQANLFHGFSATRSISDEWTDALYSGYWGLIRRLQLPFA
jgi:hypothetical protein